MIWGPWDPQSQPLICFNPEGEDGGCGCGCHTLQGVPLHYSWYMHTVLTCSTRIPVSPVSGKFFEEKLLESLRNDSLPFCAKLFLRPFTAAPGDMGAAQPATCCVYIAVTDPDGPAIYLFSARRSQTKWSSTLHPQYIYTREILKFDKCVTPSDALLYTQPRYCTAVYYRAVPTAVAT